MNEISTIVDGDRMTSLQIAEITGRRHTDVMRAIRNRSQLGKKLANASLRWLNIKTSKGNQDLATLSTKKSVSTSPPSSTMKREPS